VRKLNEKTEKRTLFSAKVAATEFIANWSWKANKIKGEKSRLYALMGSCRHLNAANFTFLAGWAKTAI